MTRMKAVAAELLIFGLLGFVGIVAPVAAVEPAVKLPVFVVKDNNGAVVGPFAGFDTPVPGQPAFYVLLTDPNEGNSIPVKVRKYTSLYVEGPVGLIYYAALGCAGSVYMHDPASSFSATVTAMDKGYGVGPNPAATNDSFLFRVLGSSIPATAHVNSKFQDGACSDFGTELSLPLIEAVPIVNLDTVAPLPWTLE